MASDRKPEDYPYPPDEGQTHHDACWQNPRHHNCAVAKVDAQAATIERLRGALRPFSEHAKALTRDQPRRLDGAPLHPDLIIGIRYERLDTAHRALAVDADAGDRPFRLTESQETDAKVDEHTDGKRGTCGSPGPQAGERCELEPGHDLDSEPHQCQRTSTSTVRWGARGR